MCLYTSLLIESNNLDNTSSFISTLLKVLANGFCFLSLNLNLLWNCLHEYLFKCVRKFLVLQVFEARA